MEELVTYTYRFDFLQLYVTFYLGLIILAIYQVE